MAPAGQKPLQAKKRTRKRKRRVASSSSSSDSDSDSSSSPALTSAAKLSKPPPLPKPSIPEDHSDSEESSRVSSSESEADCPPPPSLAVRNIEGHAEKPRQRSPSPPSVMANIEPFLPDDGPEREKQETELREKFRKFWMASIADAYEDDLQELRKEPNMNTSRLSILIDSLASGADVFSSSLQSESGQDINEIDVVLGRQ